jgi:GMP synthase-like glutamine amidotransferase
VERARRSKPSALAGHLPETFPIAVYLRDRPVLPTGAEVLATNSAGEPAVFQLRGNCLGFLGHPGIKSAMIEDLIMEFDDVPENTAEMLAALRAVQAEIAAVLGDIMVGMIELTHLMQPPQAVPP